ncbi:hypothetical protein F8178_08385 [Haloechinothrix sp. LS1_15]|nr:hypothetical protein [Haloechinothrix sp. LS1_15]
MSTPVLERFSWWQAILGGVAIAVLANLGVLAIGLAAGASFVYVDEGTTNTVSEVDVILSSAIPLTAGTLLAALVARWWPVVLRLAQIVGAGLALATIAGALAAETDSGTRIALAAMHVVIAVVVVLVLESLHRSARHRRYAG